MGKLAKIILIFFSSALLLILAVVIILPLFIDVNDYKKEIEVAVQKETGRELTIEGELNLSVFPWLGISTGKILLSNAPGFSQPSFLVIGETDIKVKLLPLLSKKVEVKTIVIKGLELHLGKNKQGLNNWSGLTAKKESKNQSVTNTREQQPSSATKDPSTQESGDTETKLDLAAIKIGGLEIKNSQVSWNDQQSGQHLVIKDFNLSTSAVAFNEPIALNIAMLLENSEPVVTEQLNISTDLIIDAVLQKIQLNNFSLGSITKGESIPGGLIEMQLNSDIAVDQLQQTLALTKLRIASNLVHLSGELRVSQLNSDLQYKGSLKVATFSPKNLMQQLALNVPATTDKNVLQKLALDFSIQGSANSVGINNLIITLDDTKLQGNIHVKQFNQPEIAFKLAVDDIDIDRYSAPKDTSGKKPASPPVVTSKTDTSDKELIPVDTLRSLNIDGDLKIAKLKVAQLKMAGVNLNIQAHQGILKTKHSITQLYNGRYQGEIKVNAKSKQPIISLNEKIIHVQLGSLLSDLQPDSKAKITGQANIAANILTNGNSIPAIKSALGGKLNFSIEKGAVRGFNIQKIIDIGKLAAKGKGLQQSYANEQTLFSIIQGSATINKGLINNPDFLAKSSTVEIKGGGTANLNNEALNYKVVATAKKGGKDISNRPVAINVKGTFSNPSYNIDLTSIQSMMTEEEKQKVDKFINKREKDIDKALGEGSGKAVNKLLKSFF